MKKKTPLRQHQVRKRQGFPCNKAGRCERPEKKENIFFQYPIISFLLSFNLEASYIFVNSLILI